MKLHNYLSLNLYSLVGYFDIAILLYLFIAVELYVHNSKFLNIFICPPTYTLSGIFSILHIFAIFIIICFLIEFMLHKFNIKIITINYDNILYKILFYIGCIITSFNILVLITFYTLMAYSK